MKTRHIPVSERPSTVLRTQESRPTRTPINGKRDVLTVKGMEEGFHYCWVNEPQVDRYLSAAYDFVTHDVVVGDQKVNAASQIGGKVSKKVGVNSDGSGLNAYLMRIDENLYFEDLDAHHAEIDEKEEQLRVSLGKNVNDKVQYGNVSIGNKA